MKFQGPRRCTLERAQKRFRSKAPAAVAGWRRVLCAVSSAVLCAVPVGVAAASPSAGAAMGTEAGGTPANGFGPLRVAQPSPSSTSVPKSTLPAVELPAVGLPAVGLPAVGSTSANTSIGDELSTVLNSSDTPSIRQLSDGRWIIPFQSTSLGEFVRVTGEDGTAQLPIPVPDGLRLVAMRAFLATSPDVNDGHLAYFGAGLDTAFVRLGNVNRSAEETEIELDLRRLETRSRRSSLTIETSLKSLMGSCITTLARATMELRKGAFVYEGTPTPPTSIPAFMTEVVSQVHILVPQSPSANEIRAAMLVAAGATNARRQHPPAISVWAYDPAEGVPDAPWDVYTRSIAVGEQLPTGLTLTPMGTTGTVLSVGGTQIVDNARALFDRTSGVLIGDRVDVTQFDGAVEPGPLFGEGATSGSSSGGASPGESTSSAETVIPEAIEGTTYSFTLDELGLNSPVATGVGQLKVPLQIDQSRLGGSIKSLNIHLEMNHTPAPARSEALLTVLVGDTLVASRDLTADVDGDSSGPITSVALDIAVGPELIGRTTGTVVKVDYIPPGGDCKTGAAPFSIQVDPFRSYYQANYGKSDIEGFLKFPQVLSPSFHVGLERMDVEHASYAIRLISSLQLLATGPLEPLVTDVATAEASSGAAVLVGGAGSIPTGYVDLRTNAVIRGANAKERVSFSTDAPFAGLVAFDDARGSKLALFWYDGSGSASAGGSAGAGTTLAASLLSTFEGERRSFRDLYGDTYLVGEGIPAVSMALGDAPLQPTATRLAPDYIARALPLLGAVGAISIVVLALASVRRRRRRRNSAAAAAVEADERDSG